MNCNEFWEHITFSASDVHDMPSELAKHLEECAECQEHYALLRASVEGLKKEIFIDPGAPFWHTLRRGVREGVLIPKKKFAWLRGWLGIGWAAGAAAAAACLAAFILFFSGGNVYTEEDLLLLSGADPVATIYEESAAISYASTETAVEPEIYLGLTDGWSVLLSESEEIAGG